MSDEELINKLYNKFVTGNNYDSRYTDDIYNSIIELDQYKNNWKELKKWVKENSWYYNTSDGCQWVDQFKILNKMKELEGE